MLGVRACRKGSTPAQPADELSQRLYDALKALRAESIPEAEEDRANGDEKSLSDYLDAKVNADTVLAVAALSESPVFK